MGNSWFKKEKPLLGLLGSGGGAGGGSVAAPEPFNGTGGEVPGGVEPGNGYRYHYYKTPGNFDVSENYTEADPTSAIEILLVAGGGNGANRSAGGGGAGGLAVMGGMQDYIPVDTAGTSIPIVVGEGGATQPIGESPGNPGSDSTFGPAAPQPWYGIAKGGGGGGGDQTPQSGAPGGSGGGGHYEKAGGEGIQPTQNPGKPWITNYGSDGSAGQTSPWRSGAGGGASGNANNSTPTERGRAGNSQNLPDFDVPLYMPAPDPYRPGINPLPGYHYGGGGGAGDYPPYTSNTMPTGATEGGGGAGAPPTGGAGSAGVNGLGGGAGGAAGPGSPSPDSQGGTGGKGIVVIRYQI
tara:strand:- start:3253 stop:4305 length:1053 start_codon:yes stop_codon:yes gene_type:complete